MTDELNESWRPIAGYDGAYLVSDAGRVKSQTRTIHRDGSPYILNGRILKISLDGHGYGRVALSLRSNVQLRYVHHLVMEAFVGPRPPDFDTCHGNGIPLDNRLSNLRYDTRSANILDSQSHGTFSEAETHPVAILTNEQALSIYQTFGESAEAIAARHGVTTAVVHQIWRGDTWRSVTGGINVSNDRGVHTYLRTILTLQQAAFALSNRANRSGRKDGRGIKPTAFRIGVDPDVIKTLYAAIDSRKPIFFAK